ncbi:MAG: O-methyltransferase [Candidatus Hodarchaeales archaeon]|jgi:predicted O-methyltransferase YrrM
MDIVNTDITEYLMELIPERDSIVKNMENYGEKKGFPIIGPLVGQFLYQYAKILNPRRILELGSGYGYSAMWFAKAITDSAKIICTDGSQENAENALNYFKMAGYDKKIEFIVGDAISTLKKLEGEFDIIFCDIDKHGYPEAITESIPRLKSGGLLITDNSLRRGTVIDKKTKDGNTLGVQKYNKIAFSLTLVFSRQ